MTTIKIQNTKHTPQVILDKENEVFLFSGKSLPENPKSFYKPILDWIDNYTEMPNANTIIKFKMLYFNTSSSKFLFEIMKRFEKVKNKNASICIDWICKPDDDEMLEYGEIYASQIDIPFNISIN